MNHLFQVFQVFQVFHPFQPSTDRPDWKKITGKPVGCRLEGLEGSRIRMN